MSTERPPACCAACGEEIPRGRGVCAACGKATTWFKIRLGLGCAFALFAFLGILAMILTALYLPRP